MLPAVAVPGNTVYLLAAWCPHCRREHWHGGGDGFGDGDGHRVAHCSDHRSPFTATGYYLREYAPDDEVVAELVRRLRRQGQRVGRHEPVRRQRPAA